ncbi:MAG: 50S ribosomal protein L20 [Planctomycetota bacterium]|nr:50S ribosomal protein L20 [Planctomycetota bacterium]
MARSRYSAARHAKKRRIMKKAKGYVGGRSKLWRIAKQAVLKAEVCATRDRRKKKRQFRRLWITRINAALSDAGISYSRFCAGLKKAAIALDRKALSEIAIHHPDAFRQIVAQAKAALGA